MAELTGADRQRYVASLFARISRHYDLMNDLMTLGMHRGWKRRAASLATQSIPGPALDVSTGTGDLALRLSRLPGTGTVVALDLLPEMIAIARSRATKIHDHGIGLIVGDALSLPFPDGAFSCSTAGFSLRNMPDVRRAIGEMARVVRPGGRVALLELSPMETGLKSSLFRAYFHGLVPLIGKLVARDRSAYTYLPQSVDRFYDAEELAAILRDAGLERVDYLRLGFGTVCIHWGDKPARVPEPDRSEAG